MKLHYSENASRLLFLKKILNHKVFRAFLLGSLCLSLNSVASARALDWGGSVFSTNLKSDLTTPLDANFVFYLGVFEDFTPTAENTADWSSHWTTIDAVNYNPTYGVFNARHEVASSDPVGQQGYIWGVRRTREDMEWILITDPSWTWPANDDFGSKINWMVGSATEAVLGFINGTGYQMVTEPVADGSPIPIISYDIWKKRFFADSDAEAAPEADPNGNNLSNIVEFALDAEPTANRGALISASVHQSESAQGRFLGVIVQPSLDANVEILGWVSPDVTFTENVSPAVVETLSDGSLLIRDDSPMGPSNARKFIRVEFREPTS